MNRKGLQLPKFENGDHLMKSLEDLISESKTRKKDGRP